LSALAFLSLALPGHTAVFAAPPAPKPLHGHVPDEVGQGAAHVLSHRDAGTVISISIGLPMRNAAALDSFLQQVNDPTSPGYHQFMTQAQVNASFNPTVRQESQVVQWLQSNGLTVTATYPNHLLVDAQGTVGQIENLLHTTINNYQGKVHGKDSQFFAPAVDPTVDASVADDVQSITGLDDVPRFHIATNGTAHGAAPYYPQDFANAYDVNSLWNTGATGSGQHIGITLWTVPPSDTTLSHFGTVTGASVATTANGRLQVIKVDGGTTAALSPDGGEAGMDIEYTGGMAPGATIDYYEAPTDSSGNPTDQGLEDALNLAGTDSNNNRQITNSWGGCEATSTSDPFISATNNIFQSNSATGHNYFFSSGDNGSWCTTNPQPDYPTSSPYVTSVGGTKFNANVGSTWPGEAAWAYSATGNNGNPEGSGGGYSKIFSRPSWQTGSGLAANGKRGYPDISADADPNTGAEVCYGASSACAQIGGTSLASPLWAGLLADINAYLAAQSKPSAGAIDATLYSLANGAPTYAPFHDVTSGTNGSYGATAAWDAVTGWGTPDVWNLARDLAGSGSSATATPTNTAAPTSTANPTNTPTKTPTPGPTSTGTPKPTNTPTATPKPTSTTGPGSQLVVNGGFESGQSPWSESSRGGYQIVDPTNPHAGADSAYLCGYNSCSDAIWQAVTLPSSFSKVTLGYWYYSDTAESGSTCYDYFYSRIRTAAGSTITTPQTSCNYGATNGWVYKTFDVTSALSSYKGQSVQVYFLGTTDGSLTSDFFVDDVTLTTS
jgi:kumamolisin